MKIKSHSFAALSTMLFFVVSTLAQGQGVKNKKVESAVEGKKGGKPLIEPRNPGSTYLDVFHASENVPKFRKENQNMIYTLHIIISNFGTADEKSSLKRSLRDFKQAVSQMYKRKLVDSENLFKKNKKDLNSLFEKMAAKYQSRTANLLDRCTDALVEVELAEAAEPGNELNSKVKLIYRNRAKLSVAYHQLVEAQSMFMIQKHRLAIGHYRVAKHYGINILQELTQDEAGKNRIAKEFAIDSKDIRNLIARANQ